MYSSMYDRNSQAIFWRYDSKIKVGRLSHEILNMVSIRVIPKYVCYGLSCPEMGAYAQSQMALECQEPKNINNK